MARIPTPTWEKSSSELVAFFENVAPRDPGIVHKKMFGYPTCFLNGNLFVGLHKQSLLFRLPELDLAAFLKLDGTAPFEPMSGRVMKGYAVWTDPLRRDRRLIAKWIGRSLEFARSLPAKGKPKHHQKKGPKAPGTD